MDSAAGLHSQLYLVSYDAAHQRFTGRPHLGMALHAAMLTDLCLRGHLHDVNGRATQANSCPPDDPVLVWAFETIGLTGHSWSTVITRSNRVVRMVRDQLRADGHLRRGHPRTFGVLPWFGDQPADVGAVTALAGSARDAVLRAISGRPCEPRPLAVGLLAVQAQFDTVLSRRECQDLRPELRELTAVTIAPISALVQAIERFHAEVRAHAGSGGCGV